MFHGGHRFEHHYLATAGNRLVLLRRRFRWAAILVATLGLLLAVSTSGASSHCATTISSYVIAVCIEAPADGATLSGEVPVSAAISIAGQNPGIQSLVFYFGDEYLLTDFEADFTFTLPTDHFVDGSYALEVEVVMRDGLVSDRAGITVTLANGITVPPVNNNSFGPRTGFPAAGQPFIVAATGDGASGRLEAAAVTDHMAAADPNLVLYLGDVYEEGTYTEFWNWYGNNDTFFSRFKDITNPTIGNHETNNGQAPGYFDYWDNVPNYYSVNTAGWHVVSLNSNSSFNQFMPGTPQYDWLQQDLDNKDSHCTLVIMHHPVYSVGLQGDTPRLNEIWQLLVKKKVDIVLAGHDHNYQRWMPLDENGNPKTDGTVQFVAGAGGQGVRPFVRSDARLVTGFDTAPDTFGSLYLTFNPDGAEFQYVNIANEILDSGALPCVGAPDDKYRPSTPSLSGAVNAAGQALLAWTASTDNTGVAGYRIYRNGQILTEVDGATKTYLDSSVDLNSEYTFMVEALDPKGNRSQPSNQVSVATPANGLLTLNAVADTYVNQENPDTNYGTSTTLRTDASPDIRSYLRFDVTGLVGAIESATLRVFTNSSSGVGYQLRAVPDNSWDELAVHYGNAPAIGNVIGASGPFAAGSWAEIDVLDWIKQEGAISFALTGLSSTAISYSSREGARPPELIIGTYDPRPIPVGTDDNNKKPAIAVDDNGIIHAVFEANDDVYYITNGSGSFSPPIVISQQLGKSKEPAIAVDSSGAVHVVWKEDVYNSNRDIYYTTASSGGNFSTPIGIGTDGDNKNPAIAADSAGNVHVVFEERDNTYYTTSSAGIFSPPIVISQQLGKSKEPDIVVDGYDQIHVVWKEDVYNSHHDIYYTSARAGGSFSTPVGIGTDDDNKRPALAVDLNGNVHVVFDDHDDIYYTSSSAGTFSNPIAISLRGKNKEADIAVDGDAVAHVVYESDQSIHYTNNGSGSFLPKEPIGTVENNKMPALGVSGSYVHVIFEEDAGNKNVYYQRIRIQPPLLLPLQSESTFLVLDKSSVAKDIDPNKFSNTDVNDDIAGRGLRQQLTYFAGHIGDTITLHTGEVGDEGWFALKTIPDTWDAAGPDDGLRNYLNAAPGLGGGSDPDALLDKIPDVTPLRATGLKQLEGRQICAIVYKSNVSISYDPLKGNLKGDNLGIVAFKIISVTELTGYSSKALPQTEILILDANRVCAGDLTLFAEAPEPVSSSNPFDTVP